MEQRRKCRSLRAITLAVLTLAACGGDGPADPGAGGGGGGGGGGAAGNCSVPVSVLGCPKGLITATLDGQPFNGGVTNGGSFYTPVAAIPSLNLPAQDSFTVGGIASNGSQLVITARAKTGTAAVGAGVIDPETRNVSVNSFGLAFPATGGNTVGAAWLTSVAGGSGTITLSSVSTTAAVGSFSITMVATPGTPATGNRTMSGTFNVTF